MKLEMDLKIVDCQRSHLFSSDDESSDIISDDQWNFYKALSGKSFLRLKLLDKGSEGVNKMRIMAFQSPVFTTDSKQELEDSLIRLLVHAGKAISLIFPEQVKENAR